MAEQRDEGGLSTRGACSKCRFSTDNVRDFSHLVQNPYKSLAYQWNRLSFMSTVDMEVAIGSEKQRSVMDLCHPNQCSVSKGRRNILIPLEQLTHGGYMFLESEWQLNGISLNKLQRR